MASSVALNEAQAHLGELLDRAERGEEIVIAREGRPGMRLIPVAADIPGVDPTTGRRLFGQNFLGITYIAPDFDAPMTEEELKEWGY
jgi:prevent-host-death family protein